jgi:stress-induced morphogen
MLDFLHAVDFTGTNLNPMAAQDECGAAIEALQAAFPAATQRMVWLEDYSDSGCDGSKLCLRIVTAEFEGQPRLARRHAVYAAVAHLMMGGSILALTVTALTPTEADGDAQAAPAAVSEATPDPSLVPQVDSALRVMFPSAAKVCVKQISRASFGSVLGILVVTTEFEGYSNETRERFLKADIAYLTGSHGLMLTLYTPTEAAEPEVRGVIEACEHGIFTGTISMPDTPGAVSEAAPDPSLAVSEAAPDPSLVPLIDSALREMFPSAAKVCVKQISRARFGSVLGILVVAAEFESYSSEDRERYLKAAIAQLTGSHGLMLTLYTPTEAAGPEVRGVIEACEHGIFTGTISMPAGLQSGQLDGSSQ